MAESIEGGDGMSMQTPFATLLALFAAIATNLKWLARARSLFSHTVFPLLSLCPKAPGFA
jgi:hypothetical protein